MFLLDTNIFELFLAGDTNVTRRITENKSVLWLSSVAAEEFLVPYLNAINRARAPRTSLSLPRAHEDFTEAITDMRLLPILVYSEEADAVFKTFPASITRTGSQDCRIAAQALAHGLTVVTRNRGDFEKIGAPCEDWSA